MKKAVYNSKKERTKRRRKLEEKTRKEILERKFQEENCKGIGNVWIWIFLMQVLKNLWMSNW